MINDWDDGFTVEKFEKTASNVERMSTVFAWAIGLTITATLVAFAAAAVAAAVWLWGVAL